ncbi:hypothetical protein [Kitasatospora sp. GP82]|uniref:hypothetical protein n=1 Tax=Kitasatospora sp. GP82 TaxID=3035089 RepID=UPI0024752B1C|nr:hypothetical protein [Kitasatospora sp. GP82]
MDPYGLAKVGRHTQEVAAAMPAEIVRMQGPSEEAVGGLSGWRTGRALAECTESWAGCLRALAAEVDANGANLITTAQNYAAADAAAHEALPGPSYGAPPVPHNGTPPEPRNGTPSAQAPAPLAQAPAQAPAPAARIPAPHEQLAAPHEQAAVGLRGGGH